MRYRFVPPLMLACVLVLASPGSHPAAAQTNKPSSPKDCDYRAPTDKSCAGGEVPAASSPQSPAAQQYPYPGDAPAAKPNQATQPSAATPASKQFPYPGDAAPTDGNSARSSSSAGGSSSSSSSSSSGSSSSSSSSSSAADPDDPLDPSSAANQPPGRRKLPKVTNLQTDDEREAEDVKVARFYHDDGNNLAAYNRLEDATKLIPDDADAWYLLGQVAAKMNKPAESLSAYRKFLKLEPDTRRAKTLAKSMPELQAAR